MDWTRWKDLTPVQRLEIQLQEARRGGDDRHQQERFISGLHRWYWRKRWWGHWAIGPRDMEVF